jgi:hypothetical protein
VIIASILLIFGAAGLLVLGLWQSSSLLLSGSIAASLLAAILLVVATRRGTAARRLADPAADDFLPDRPAGSGGRPTEAVTMTIPVQGAPGRGGNAPEGTGLAEEEEDLDPPDEPAPQQVSAADAARVGRMQTDVLVVDGRPRYHLPGCVHLLGRESEPLPVGEAIDLGFTPCSLCEPDSALLADARRV